ncbi:YgjV family protein [Endozoicomonas sp. 8E]|uniref:YgjV family protein n=1 Tax=Endozoicomonas sp. 8E TaxID=3035692 RepID=UPI002938EF5A|nr:YgjV family protein [Endozoicomonas sp. 8E]WOG29512.1 YgjV family protein [Endozoicomonas sp. 8E]
MDNYTLSQILVSIAIVFDLLSFQFKTRKHVVLCLFIAGVLIATHFYLLNAFTAAVVMTIASIRYLTSYFSSRPGVRNLFLIINGVTLFVTYESFISLVAFVGSCLQTIGAFSKDDREMRLIMMVGTVVWLSHNVLVLSPMAVVMEVLFLLSNIVAYLRFYNKSPIVTKSEY